MIAKSAVAGTSARGYRGEVANPDDQWDDLFQGLAQVRERWPSRDWSYDRRFKCVATTVALSAEAAILPILGAVLTASWTGDSVDGAPDDVRAVAEACGGLRSSQRIYWSGGALAPGAFGLWWPWGDGTQVSLRIGLHDVDLPKQRYPRLRDVFGIAQAPGPV
jgi:hypothetical protein